MKNKKTSTQEVSLETAKKAFVGALSKYVTAKESLQSAFDTAKTAIIGNSKTKAKLKELRLVLIQ